MLQARHVNLALVFPGEFDHFVSGQRLGEGGLTALPIQGVAEETLIYVVTPKTPQGTRLIATINGLIRRFWADPEFRSTAFFGLSPPEQVNLKRFLARGPEAP